MTGDTMSFSTLMAISPVDGRYSNKVESLRPVCSEYGLLRYRIAAEVAWLHGLAAHPDIKEIPLLSDSAQTFLNALAEEFDENAAARIKSIEQTTRHDVKAVEYYIKERLQENAELSAISEFVHFACTSEDINNVAYALMLRDARDLLLTEIDKLIITLVARAQIYAHQPMLSRTHGQPASPTTLGKEFANVVARLRRQRETFAEVPLSAKLNGAVGNFNAHVAAYPEIDWPTLADTVLTQLGLTQQTYTTQIEPHDWIAEYCDALARCNTILIDFCRDTWGYIALNYFKQLTKENEVGSSTMPHKVNPIDFENAEGNLGIANALCHHFSHKLPISRWQRDLTDSTVLRNVGVAIAHSFIALSSLQIGLSKIDVNVEVINKDLDQQWPVLSEAIQTVMRRYGIENPYEQLKLLTRGQSIDEQTLRNFIQGLNLNQEVKDILLSLTPSDYIGLAAELASNI